MSDSNLLLLLASGPELTAEAYVKDFALLSYPESYVKAGATLERHVEIYAKVVTSLQAEVGKYLKFFPTLQSAVDIYVKCAVLFPIPPERYLKTASSLVARSQDYIRSAVRFAENGSYVKVRAALLTAPLLTDLPDTVPDDKLGIISRQYISLVSVKKEV